MRISLISVFLITTVFFGGVTVAGDFRQEKKVLVLNSYSYDQDWTRSINIAIHDVLVDYPEIQQIVEFMDTKRHNSPEYYQTLYTLYKKKYSNTKFDAIITSDDNAVNFALKYRDELFPDVPIVFCGVNNISLPEQDDFINITGSLEVPGVKETIDTIIYLQPDLKKLYIISESTTSGKNDRIALEKVLTEYIDVISVEWIEGKSDEEVGQILKSLSGNSAVMLLSYFPNKKQVTFNISDGAKFISSKSTQPVYSMWDYFLGNGILGGMLTSGKYQGKAAAELALKVLFGTHPQDIPIISQSSNQLMFDYQQMERFSIAEDELPAGSVVVNKPSSVLRKYRLQFFVAIAVIGILLLVCVALAYNIRARRRIEIAFKTSEKRFRAAFDSAKDCIGICDRNYDYLYTNHFYLDYYGIKLGLGSEKNVHVALSHIPEYRDKWISRINRAFQTGESFSFQDEFNLNGKKYYAETILTPVVDKNENVEAVCMVSRDVTERMQAGIQHKELEEKLQHSEKMKSIGFLAGGIAHDFNNILGVIIGSAEIMAMKNPERSDITRSCEMIISSAETAAGLTAKLLAFARKQKTSFKSIEVNSLVADSIDILKRTICRIVEIDFNSNNESLWVNGDFAQLQNVIINIGINAEHSMVDGGIISISIQRVSLNEEYCQASPFDISEGEYAEIELNDTGCGISPANLSQIFDPFFTTRDLGKGTGLGLATVYGAVQLHKGAIKVSSEEGIGTSFKVLLPLNEVVRKENVKSSKGIVSGSGHILVADDEPLMLETIVQLLRDLGYTVEKAKNGKVALDMFKVNPGGYDLVILDMIMPVMTGKKCFYELLKLNPEIRIILASGYSQDLDIEQLKKDGLAGYISKPFSTVELSQLVKQQLPERG